MGHETLWFPQNIGKAPTPCCGTPSARAELERGRAPSAGIGRLGVAVAAGLGERRRGSLVRQAGSWPAVQADGPTMPTIAATVAERGQDLRLSQRSLDLEAHGHGDMVGVSGALSPLARVEDLAELALELSGAGTPGHPARRTSDRALEALQVAGHKKKPEDLAPISRSSTRAVFCLSPRVVGPGRLRARRRSSSTVTNMTASRRWPPSQCRPSASTWGYMLPSSRSISPRYTWLPFCGSCYATCGATSSSSGTKGQFTRGLRLQRSREPTLASISKSSRPTPPNSTLSNSSGITSKAIRRTACRATCGTSTAVCMPTPAESGAPRRNCDRSFWLLNCLRHHEKLFITYAKFNNCPNRGLKKVVCRPAAKFRSEQRLQKRNPLGKAASHERTPRSVKPYLIRAPP
jgi:hypothetical protein